MALKKHGADLKASVTLSASATASLTTTSASSTDAFRLTPPSQVDDQGHAETLDLRQYIKSHRLRLVSKKIIKAAVYNHLRFLRARGVNHVDVEDVAQALNVPPAEVKRLAATMPRVKFE
jgi:hypothetical protein